MSNEIKQIRKLESLAEKLVPSKFRTDSPQYFELIKAFLINLQRVQDTVNNNLISMIDIDKIDNDEIVSIYVDTYLKTMNISDVDSITAMKDMTKISKELITKKGTSLLYNLLARLLAYLFPALLTQYKDLKERLEVANTQEDIDAINEQLLELENVSSNLGYVDIIEEEDESNPDLVVPFTYIAESNYSREIFEKHIKPFCHPAGWHVQFIELIRVFAEDIYKEYLRFNMTVSKKFPKIRAGAGYVSGNTNNRFTKYFDDRIELGDSSREDYFRWVIDDQSRLVVENGKVYYVGRGLNVTPPYKFLNLDAMISAGLFTKPLAGFDGCVAGLDSLVAGNTNNQFPLKVLSFKYIDGNFYHGKEIYKIDNSVNLPILDGQKSPILEDGTARDTKYIKYNQYNNVFPFVAGGSSHEVRVGSRYAGAGGGAIAGRLETMYDVEIVDDKKEY